MSCHGVQLISQLNVWKVSCLASLLWAANQTSETMSCIRSALSSSLAFGV
jgi:hypothetical protein